ncbi:MAG: ATP-dependent carboxylate-amine ligase [Rhodobacteraceae bacterium]|nr:ATP-dependent carboxylate-amine ligase [Paracoccaceae bacterium]
MSEQPASEDTKTGQAPGGPLVQRLLKDWCARNNLKLVLDDALGHAGYIESKDGKRSFFIGTRFDLNPLGASEIAKDKAYALEFMAKEGLPTPKTLLLTSPEEQQRLALKRPGYVDTSAQAKALEDFLSATDFPLFVKPNDGQEGEDVCKVPSRAALETILTTLFARHTKLLVQQEAKGREFRSVVLNGQILFSIERNGPQVTGDGASSLSDLMRDHHPELEDQIIAHLTMQDLSVDLVPDAECDVALLPTTNLSKGGKAKLVEAELPSPVSDGILAAGKAIGLAYYAIDYLSPSLTDQDTDWTILEINAAPGLAELARQNDAMADRVKQTYEKLFNALSGTLQ